jgi:lipopolysaccharide export system permease protein
LKKIDQFILKSFAGPYVLSFFIAEFVLIMQFLWKYIDDILGKGFGVLEILELILYNALQLVPTALPISILLASVMVFGEISEKYELSTMKSAGVSLLRVMRPAIYLSMATFIFSIIASNFIKPAAAYQYKKRFDLIRKQKTTLAIEEGIFNGEFPDIVIRVDKKAENNVDMKSVLLYDQSQQDRSLLNMIKADSAKMYPSEDGKFFFMNLVNGVQVQEMDRTPDGSGVNKYPMMRTTFKTWDKVVDMSNFYLSESDIMVSRNREDMLNTVQLFDQLDSINRQIKQNTRDNSNDYFKFLDRRVLSATQYASELSKKRKDTTKAKEVSLPLRDTIDRRVITRNDGSITVENAMAHIKKKSFNKSKALVKEAIKTLPVVSDTSKNEIQKQAELDKHFKRRETANIETANINNVKYFYQLYDSLTIANLVRKATPYVSSNMDKANNYINSYNTQSYQKENVIYHLSSQYSNALVCILFLFIGAPLGSIIRKGGYGYPLLVAILFYILFIIASILGTKLMKSDKITGLAGGWMPCLILLPFCIFFTYKALKDASFNGIEKLEKFINNLQLKWRERKYKKDGVVEG